MLPNFLENISFMAKKILLAVLFLFTTLSAWTVDWFAFGGSFGTSAIVNTDKSIRQYTENFHRIVLEFDITTEFTLHPAIRLSFGSILLTDFRFKNDNHFNSLDYNFYTGVRVYPGLAGLRLGVDYNLGRRTDFIQIDSLQDTRSTRWGNGFRFLLEYDFRAGKTGLLPIIGGGWRHVPRGGSSDHIFSVYFKLLYR